MTDFESGSTKNRPRSPMQWNGNSQAGFTSGASSWTPVNPDYKNINVADQEDKPGSRLNVS